MREILKKTISLFLSTILLFGLIGVIPTTADDTPTVWDGSIAVSFTGGSGTEEDPYRIGSGAELALLASYVNAGEGAFNSKYYQLTADIYLNDITDYENWTASTTGLNKWVPIGLANTFSGNFNGAGHTVYGLYMSGETAGRYVGLFGTVSGAVKIGSFSLLKAYADITFPSSIYTSTEKWSGFGGIAGRICSGATVEEVAVNGIFKATKPSGTANHLMMGGIVGEAGARLAANAEESPFAIRNCAFFGSVYQVNCSNTNSCVSGICGVAAVAGITVSIENCCNAGTISADTPKAAGGILGMAHGMWTENSTVNVKNCYNTGAIHSDTSTSGTGGIIGFLYASSTVENCFNIGVISDSARPRQMVSDSYAASYGYVFAYKNVYINADDETMAGTMACNNSAISLSLGANEFIAENIGSFPDDVWYLYTGKLPVLKGIPGISDPGGTALPHMEPLVLTPPQGSGTEAEPYLISTGGELAYIAEQVNNGVASYCNGYYSMTSDIYLNDVSGFDSWGPDSAGLNEWTPIGQSNPFGGYFDGNSHTVYGMFIKGSASSYIGLFGFLKGSSNTARATIKNLRVAYSLICANKATSMVGGIVARMDNAEVENCSSDVDITITGSKVNLTVGGVVGFAPGTGFAIRNCSNAGNLYIETTGSWSNIGGIIGAGNDKNNNNGIVENCYNLGAITHEAVSKGVGGIIGMEGDDNELGTVYIRNCYNLGKITGGSANVAGICGFVRTTTTIEGCFNIGESTGKQIRGDVYGGTLTIRNCYHNSDLEAIAGGNGSVKLSAKKGEFVSERMDRLSGEVWNLTPGERPTLKDVYAPNDLQVLGAQIRLNRTEYYRDGEKVAEGQGIRFGAAYSQTEKFMNNGTLTEGYQIGILIAKTALLYDEVLTVANAEQNQSVSTFEVENGTAIITAYLVGIEPSGYNISYSVRAYVMKDDAVVFYSDVITRSVLTVADNLGGSIDSEGFFEYD